MKPFPVTPNQTRQHRGYFSFLLFKPPELCNQRYSNDQTTWSINASSNKEILAGNSTEVFVLSIRQTKLKTIAINFRSRAYQMDQVKDIKLFSDIFGFNR